MNLKNFKITNRGLYWGLIITFSALYLGVGFVSTLHSITFFNLANSMSLAILLGLTYEVGQAAVLFSILMTKNKDRFLPWMLMFLLTALQVTANVYASFKWMVESDSNNWVHWQKSILIGVTAANPEMYQIIISWIAGALLPIVALGMTALVAENMKMMNDEKQEVKVGTIRDEEVDEIINNEVAKRTAEIVKPQSSIEDFIIKDSSRISLGTIQENPTDVELKDYKVNPEDLINPKSSKIIEPKKEQESRKKLRKIYKPFKKKVKVK